MINKNNENINDDKIIKWILYWLWSSALAILAISANFSEKNYNFDAKWEVENISNQWENIKIIKILDKISKWCFQPLDEMSGKILCKSENIKKLFSENNFFDVEWYKISLKNDSIIFSKNNKQTKIIFTNNVYKIINNI